MKKLLLLLVLFEITLFSNPLFSQQDSVPIVVVTSSQFERVLVVRIKTGNDLLEGLTKAVEMEKIKNAVIINGIGSVTQISIHTVKLSTFPTQNIFLTEKNPYDILNINGFIVNGRIHAHIAFSDLKKTIGGHLEPGTLVYTFAIITIGVLSKDANMENFDNWKWDILGQK